MTHFGGRGHSFAFNWKPSLFKMASVNFCFLFVAKLVNKYFSIKVLQ